MAHISLHDLMFNVPKHVQYIHTELSSWFDKNSHLQKLLNINFEFAFNPLRYARQHMKLNISGSYFVALDAVLEQKCIA